ncbi:MAG: response regulator [Firmicutes bacterium]|nr:response regulator [Bacillota bacterium]
MYDLMIVDDHKWTREGLTRNIPWKKKGIRVKYVVSNGKQALAAMNEHPVDIIITDIKMDIMDGLELTKHVKSKWPSTKIIMISAYPDFSYAQEAVNMGVSAYILKPIKEEELIEKISRVIETIESERLNISKALEFDRFNVSDLLKEYITGSRPNDANILDKLCKKGIDLLKGKSIVFTVKVLRKHDLQKKVYQDIFNMGKNFASFIHGSLTIGVYTHAGEMSQYDFNKYLLRLKDEFKGLDLRICTGSMAKKPEELRKSYQDSLKVYNYAFLCNLKGIISYDKVKDKISRHENGVFFDFNEVRNIINSYGEIDIARYIDSILEMHKRSNTDRYLIESQCVSMLVEISRYVSERGILPESIFEKCGPISSMKDMEFLEDISNYIKNVLYSVIHEVKKRNTKKIRPIVKRAIDYACKNIDMKDITIKSIAEKIGVSYVYLSKAFKQDVGVNFTEYLNRYRVGISKKYLVETDMKIYEISDIVGLEPKNYYILFKKYESITPMEYRKMYG